MLVLTSRVTAIHVQPAVGDGSSEARHGLGQRDQRRFGVGRLWRFSRLFFPRLFASAGSRRSERERRIMHDALIFIFAVLAGGVLLGAVCESADEPLALQLEL